MPDADDNIFQAVPVSHRDLLTARGTAVFTTVDHDNRPQSTAVWYLVDHDGLLKLSSTANRQKYKNLRRSRSCTLFLIDPDDSHRTLEIRAEAELIADPDSADITRFANAYGIEPSAVIADNRYTIILRPRRIITNPPVRTQRQ